MAKQKFNIAMYAPEEEILTRALESTKGLRLRPPKDAFDPVKWSTSLVHRLNKCRVADRQRNTEMYPEPDARSGKSLFDGLLIRQTKDAKGEFVEVSKRDEILIEAEIEEIE